MAKEVYVVERHKDRTGLWVILAAGALLAFWRVIVLGAIIVCLLYLARLAYKSYREHQERKISRDEAIALRADYQHRLALGGDPLGVYGNFTPATMPITQPEYIGCYDPMGSWQDNHNDGFKDW